MFSHIVIFNLKKDLSPAQIEEFEAGLESLRSIPAILFDFGKPAPSERAVVQKDYDYQLTTLFTSQDHHDIYQEHPTHKKFIADCAHLWEKVRVYDAK